MTAKDGKDCKLFLPAAEATEIEMQALVDAAEEELDEEERHAEERIRDRQRVGRWRTEEAKHRSLLKSEHP